jgi:hypothetical protein
MADGIGLRLPPLWRFEAMKLARAAPGAPAALAGS